MGQWISKRWRDGERALPTDKAPSPYPFPKREGSTLALLVVGCSVFITSVCFARGDGEAPCTLQARGEIRSGGVLEESYTYHRQQAPSTLPSSVGRGNCGGWYGYGFPVSTFRWGWFGAEHYYPTVWWHDGYYGECCRYAYRRGY